MSKEKKKWVTPKLICLYKGRPEEAVLAACKAPPGTPGPNSGLCAGGEIPIPCKYKGQGT